MQSTIYAARGRGHLSRHERQRLARAEAFSRRTPSLVSLTPERLDGEELKFIERLVRHDRTAVSIALLVIAGIGAGERRRRAVLAGIGKAAGRAWAEGAISRSRAAQIERHVERAISDKAVAA
jgi:hypothetical protein